MIHRSQRLYPRYAIALLSVSLTVSVLSLAAPAPKAQSPHTPATLVAVVHIDLDSTQVQRGVTILDRYAADCRKDPGNLSFMILQETARDNHLTLIETWRDQTAFQRHADSLYAKRFRNNIQPLLGSPFDERLHHLLQL